MSGKRVGRPEKWGTGNISSSTIGTPMALSALMSMHADQRSPAPRSCLDLQNHVDEEDEGEDDVDDENDEDGNDGEVEDEDVAISNQVIDSDLDSEDEIDNLPVKRVSKKSLFFDDEAGEVVSKKKSATKSSRVTAGAKKSAGTTSKVSRGKKATK